MESSAPPSTSDLPPPRLFRDRRVLGILIANGVIAIIVLLAVNLSGAFFTSTSRSSDNEFAAGSMELQLSKNGQIVDGAGLVPGASRSGDQTVTNAGHRGTLKLDAAGLDTDSALAKVLRVSVRQTNPTQTQPAYDGPLTGLVAVALGTLGHDERRTYTITVTWPASETSPALAGTKTSLAFDWTIESVP